MYLVQYFLFLDEEVALSLIPAEQPLPGTSLFFTVLESNVL